MRLALVAFVFALTSCAAFKNAPDPATAARDARRVSVAACNAYDAAVRSGALQATERADLACAATRGICADVEP